MANEGRLTSFLFVKEVLWLSVVSLKIINSITDQFRDLRSSKTSNTEENTGALDASFLDLPEIALECILGRLSPASLSNMAATCRSLKERCRSDYLWETHFKERWGKVIGPVAKREWQRWLFLSKEKMATAETKANRLLGFPSRVWPLSWLKSDDSSKSKCLMPDDSLMSWYCFLESGKFWFPAQVYSPKIRCLSSFSFYDVELSYDCKTDTFNARYPQLGQQTHVVEEAVNWDRIRAPIVNIPAQDLYMSDCLQDLHPYDSFEIQWRSSEEFPYGWTYGTVSHHDSCDSSEDICVCPYSDTVVLEFSQFSVHRPWKLEIYKNYDYEGVYDDMGFFGGIRRLSSMDEIRAWWERLP